MAIAIRIARMAITIISSMSVKPPLFFMVRMLFISCSWFMVYESSESGNTASSLADVNDAINVPNLALAGEDLYLGTPFGPAVRILPDFSSPGKGRGDENCQCWRKSGGSNGVPRVFIKTRLQLRHAAGTNTGSPWSRLQVHVTGLPLVSVGV